MSHRNQCLPFARVVSPPVECEAVESNHQLRSKHPAVVDNLHILRTNTSHVSFYTYASTSSFMIVTRSSCAEFIAFQCDGSPPPVIAARTNGRMYSPELIPIGRLTVRFARPVFLENPSSVSTSRISPTVCQLLAFFPQPHLPQLCFPTPIQPLKWCKIVLA